MQTWDALAGSSLLPPPTRPMAAMMLSPGVTAGSSSGRKSRPSRSGIPKVVKYPAVTALPRAPRCLPPVVRLRALQQPVVKRAQAVPPVTEVGRVDIHHHHVFTLEADIRIL